MNRLRAISPGEQLLLQGIEQHRVAAEPAEQDGGPQLRERLEVVQEVIGSYSQVLLGVVQPQDRSERERQAHQEDVATSQTDTQNELLCRDGKTGPTPIPAWPRCSSLRAGQRAAHGGAVLRKSEFLHSRIDKLVNQAGREWVVDRKMQRPFRALIAGKVTT